MKRMRRAVVCAMTGLAVIAAPAVPAAASPPHEADHVELQERLDDVVSAGAVGVLAEVRDGKRTWRGSSGSAELDSARPVLTHSRFRIGSITKTFLATVVLQLVDDGPLRLDDSVQRWLPGVVPSGHRITVRQLLNHTSGLYDFQDTLTMPPSPEFLDVRWRTWTAPEMVRRAVANPPTSKTPGSEYAYTNTGYLLLGQIIEQVTGHSYDKEIERRIIEPLSLDGTSLPGTFTRIRGPHPHGYVPIQHDDGIRLVDFTEMNPSLFGAAGEMISTTRDLNRFMSALLDGRLLPEHLLHQMETPGVEGATYGLGLRWDITSCGVPVYGNDGDAAAYQAWTFSTADQRHQASIALTPEYPGDPDDAVDAFLDEAFCGHTS